MVKINFKLSKYFWDKNPGHDSMWKVSGSNDGSDGVTSSQVCFDRPCWLVCQWIISQNMFQYFEQNNIGLQVQDTDKG